ncbi:MAG: hypothetical protein ACRD1Q_15330 [Vicinamibacterales bacterium]
MTFKRGLLGAAVLLIVILGAYVLGYWPERAKRMALESEVAALRGQLNDAEARVRMARLLGELVNVLEATSALNYGQAQGLASKFFDAARAEATTTPVPSFKTTLEGILQNRDQVTAALTRADPAVTEILRSAQLQLRTALGYPVPQPS